MAKKKLLSLAMKEGSFLHQHVRSGMTAFLKADVALVHEGQRSRVSESIDLDAASKPGHEEENRWDYLVSIEDMKRLVAIEPHSAKDSEVSVVIAKKQNAMVYLRSHLKNGYRIHRWVWVTHGKVSFSRMDKARRRLDKNAIEFVGRILRNFDEVAGSGSP